MSKSWVTKQLPPDCRPFADCPFRQYLLRVLTVNVKIQFLIQIRTYMRIKLHETTQCLKIDYLIIHTL